MKMEKILPVLQVRLFGKERITYGDTPILHGRNSISKAMKLLLILLYYGSEGIPRNRLIENLYGREEMADVSNNLRVTIHRLKKMLIDAGLPEHEYILYKGGFYFWNSPIETIVDTDVFRGLIQSSQEAASRSEKTEILREVCQLYSGEFLVKLSSEEWVVMESVRYRDMYTKTLQELCTLLMEDKEYQEVLKLVEPACEMYPFDEWQAVKIDCYIAMNRYKDALREYELTSKFLLEELGVTPSERMMKQFKIMNEHISHRPQIISEIKEGLKNDAEQRGALYCSFPGFRDAYRMMQRGMERTGQSIFLLLCTLVNSKGHPMENSEKLDELAHELHNSIQQSLRRSDSFTKYNRSQFLVMLVGTNEENCQIVIDRIVKRFTREHKNWGQYIQCSVSSLLDTDM